MTLLYEQPPLLRVTGAAIRPGGLALTDRALNFCALPAGSWVIDAGCGQGTTVEHLITRHGLNAIGIDTSTLLLQTGLARTATPLPLIQAAGEAIPVASSRFDALLAECTLSLMDMDQALDEFCRVLRPQGFLIVTDLYARDPDGISSPRDLPIRSCVVGAVAQTEVIERVTARGFTIRLWEDHTDALKLLAARLIWEHGSLAQFWQCAAHHDGQALQRASERAKPGYYLLIAQKTTL